MNGTLSKIGRAVRPAAHAGRFYEVDLGALRKTVDSLLAEAPHAPSASPPLALLAPHAGYLYSGRVAAAAFRSVQGMAFDRVMILAPTHTRSFAGAALPAEEAFETPLGRIPVDRQAVERLLSRPGFGFHQGAHDEEHAIEVELPFLQVALAGPFQILPMTFGELPPGGLRPLAGELAALIESRRERGEKWLVAASSDTYHGHDRQACQANDEALMLSLRSMNADEWASKAAGGEIMACGWKAIALTMMLAERLGARECRILGHRDSSEALGRSREEEPGRYVVGYVGAAFE